MRVPFAATLRVAGMTCDHCVRAVTEALQELPGVSGVVVDLESGMVVLSSHEPIDDEAIRAAVDEAGYEVAP